MFEDIRTDIRRLIAAYEAAKAESEELKTELQLCRDRIEDYRKQISELERQIDSLKLADALMVTSKDRREARERIDRMIRAIDKCISLIGS
ncbi:MAG: hypothetical protein IAC23_06495 [Bacteroidetes bacterium]|uniref:Uncharacterized protein n=1 Tax=Candidatus Cryptobacteroides merdavium TaxID=2840769 RepID=A0A9D9ECP4_9BACT|nr:hypothetical protein [Candidatus Cryptobacteroides merdavium]